MFKLMNQLKTGKGPKRLGRIEDGIG